MDTRALADTAVLDASGKRIRLGDLWRTRPVVVVWLRHFGCIYCREHAVEVTRELPAITAAGADLVFIGNGSPRAAAWFRDKFVPGTTVLTDPERDSYRVIGARSGVVNTMGPRTWGAAVRALRKGARQSSVRGHPFQQGAVLVVAPGDELVYSHISARAGDHPPTAAVIDAVRGIGSAPAQRTA
jgi:prostamide/prostaglandin F2alpha synthase